MVPLWVIGNKKESLMHYLSRTLSFKKIKDKDKIVIPRNILYIIFSYSGPLIKIISEPHYGRWADIVIDRCS